MKEINLAVIGCGSRGAHNVLTIMMADKDVNILAVSDPYKEKMDLVAQNIVENGRKEPLKIADYKDILKMEEVNTVLVFTSWETHIKIAIETMNAKKAVGIEVGGARDLEECYELVEAWERTKTPFMMLENCCFGKGELLALKLAREGKFGEVVYCHGAYGHDLRQLMVEEEKNGHYRLSHYKNRNCENYPTHELGPIAKILDINRGNRMVKLVSVSSKSAGLKKYISDRRDSVMPKELIDMDFKQGDILDTLITCENGETISIRLDTTLPRFYSREFTVRGTQGMYEGSTNTLFFDGEEEEYETPKYLASAMNNADRFYYKYLTKYWQDITKEEIDHGHGGIDVYCFRTFFECLKKDLPMPVDVYDAAAWMCITPLSEASIQSGGFMEIPDFTKGAYKTRERCDIIDLEH